MKRKISDLLDEMQVNDVELRQTMPLSSQRIKELTMDKVKKAPAKRRIGFKLLLAAAVIAVMTMTVFAAERIMTYDNWFEDFFSGKEVVADISENQLALLDQTMARVDKSVTSGGYTVTLETALTDGYVAYLTLRVEAPEERALDAVYYKFGEVPMDWLETASDGIVSVIGAGWQLLEDGEPEDNSVRLLLKLDADEKLPFLTDGAEKTLVLRTFWEDRGPEADSERIAEGDWTFSFTFGDLAQVTQEVEMLSQPVRCTGRRQLGQSFTDVTVKMTSFKLRALTATCVYEEPLTGYWEGILLDPIYVVLKDGTCVRARYSAGVTLEDGFKCTLEFDVPISFADVDHVEFGGGDRAYMPG